MVTNLCICRHTADPSDDDENYESEIGRIPNWWWMGGLAASAVFCTAVLSPMLHLPWFHPVAALILALLVAVLAVRALGQTDLNPVSGVGKLSQVYCTQPPP